MRRRGRGRKDVPGLLLPRGERHRQGLGRHGVTVELYVLREVGYRPQGLQDHAHRAADEPLGESEEAGDGHVRIIRLRAL